MNMQYMLLFLSLFPMGCGGSADSPVTGSSATYVNNTTSSGSDVILSGTRFKSAQDALKWVARFYEQSGVNVDEFYGQLVSLYESGISLGHLFILARVSYVTGLEPAALALLKEGDNGWTAVMDAFQIQGLGAFLNLGEFLRNNSGNGIVDGTPGNK